MNRTLLSEYERSFRDSIMFLLASACRPGARVEEHVAQALARFFLIEPVSVVWSWGDASTGAEASGERGVRRMGAEEPPALRARLGEAQPLVRREGLEAWLYRGEPQLWGLEIAAAELGRERLLVVIEATRTPEPEARERMAFFTSYASGLLDLFTVVKALHASARLAEWVVAVERVTSASGTPLAARFEEAAGLIRQMSESPSTESMQQVERLAIWAMQSHLGTGWRVRRLEAHPANLQALCSRIREAASRWEQLADATDGTLPERLRRLADILAAETSAREALEAATDCDGDEPLALLREYTRLHEEARRVWRTPAEKASDGGEESWLRSIGATRPAMVRFLASTFERANADAAHLRNWLRLWLCQELDWTLGEDALSSQHVLSAWGWRADLAYVLREGLRFASFGDRPDYLVQPDVLAGSLRRLVEFHAFAHVGVPASFEVPWILDEIARAHRADDHVFTTGHLQHVLESYIFGNFLCSVIVTDPRRGDGVSYDRWTLAEVLASSGSVPNPDRAATLRRAFSVASLFHDVGMVLFPRYPELAASISENRDDELHRQLSSLRDELMRSGTALSRVCVEQLKASTYVREDVDPELVRWLDKKASSQESRPDHALLGSWFLYRVYHQSSEADPLLRWAARAVLLHQAIPAPIGVDTDPVAGLLVLADELFEWDPYARVLPAQDPTSKSLHTMAIGVPAETSRARAVRLCGVSARDDHASLRMELERNADEPDGWPQIVVTLKHPESLACSVHHCWLTMAQNLTRVRPHHDWAPTIRVESEVPYWLEPRGGTARFLRRAFLRDAPARRAPWISWMGDARRFTCGGGIESARIDATGQAFFADVREHLPRLELAAEKRERDAEQETHDSGFPPPSQRA